MCMGQVRHLGLICGASSARCIGCLESASQQQWMPAEQAWVKHSFADRSSITHKHDTSATVVLLL